MVKKMHKGTMPHMLSIIFFLLFHFFVSCSTSHSESWPGVAAFSDILFIKDGSYDISYIGKYEPLNIETKAMLGNPISDTITSLDQYYLHTLFATTQGNVYAWGQNYGGILGDGTYNNAYTPRRIGLGNIRQVGCGYIHSLALSRSGIVYAWGKNNSGQLGDNTEISSTVPKKVSGLSQIVCIRAGEYSSYALDMHGNIYGWGMLGGTISHKAPEIIAQSSDIIDFIITLNKIVILKKDRTVWSTNITGGSFSQIPNLSDITKITDNKHGRHVLALRQDGTVWGWGFNGDGAIGTGTSSYEIITPQQSLINNVVDICTSDSRSFFLKEDGTIYMSGRDDHYLFGALRPGFTLVVTPTQTFMSNGGPVEVTKMRSSSQEIIPPSLGNNPGPPPLIEPPQDPEDDEFWSALQESYSMEGAEFETEAGLSTTATRSGETSFNITNTYVGCAALEEKGYREIFNSRISGDKIMTINKAIPAVYPSITSTSLTTLSTSTKNTKVTFTTANFYTYKNISPKIRIEDCKLINDDENFFTLLTAESDTQFSATIKECSPDAPTNRQVTFQFGDGYEFTDDTLISVQNSVGYPAPAVHTTTPLSLLLNGKK